MTKNYINHWPMCAHHPLCFTDFYKFSGGVKVADAACGGEEPSDKANFKLWKHFDFPGSVSELIPCTCY